MLLVPKAGEMLYRIKPDQSSMSNESSNTVRGCLSATICPDTCALVVTVEGGRATRVAGAVDHPTTNGFLCTKVEPLPRADLQSAADSASDEADRAEG
jgi:anaerobic selenocysteine-containing dehydrogenase